MKRYPFYRGQEVCFFGTYVGRSIPKIYGIVEDDYKYMPETITMMCSDWDGEIAVVSINRCVPWEVRDEK